MFLFDAVTIVGVLGASIILVAFSLNQTNKLTVESRWYDGLNALGSVLLLVYAVLLVSYPFMILNAVWLLVSLHGLMKQHKA